MTIVNTTGTGTGSTPAISISGTESGTIVRSSVSNAIYNSVAGTVNINGGRIEGEYVIIYNKDAGEINITGGKIISQSNDGIQNCSTGTINVTSAEITGYVGIRNSGTGTIVVNSGTITGTTEQRIRNNDAGIITVNEQ